jgi:hypothetical protein
LARETKHGRRRLIGIVELQPPQLQLAKSLRMANDEPKRNDPPLENLSSTLTTSIPKVAQNAVREAAKDLNGVRDVQFVGGGAIVTYNPIGITKEEICAAIRRSGYRATEITSARAK